MTARVWDRFLTEQDAAHVTMVPAIAKGGGERPAVLFIDLYRGVFGHQPAPLLEAVRAFPKACGLTAWEALPHIQRLLGEARALGVPVIHLTKLEDIPSWREGSTSMPGEFDILPEVAPVPGEVVLRKAAPSGFWGTPLAALLNELRIDTVVVAGESTSGCIRATVVDAKSHRFKVIVPEETVFDRHEAAHAINLFDMNQKYADVVALDEAIAYLRSVGAASVPA